MYLRRVTQSLYLGGALCAARSYWPTVSSVVLRNRLISISASIFIICSEQLPVWAKLICAAKNVWFMGTLSSQAKIFALRFERRYLGWNASISSLGAKNVKKICNARICILHELKDA